MADEAQLAASRCYGVILTAIPVEYSAVRGYLVDPVRHVHPSGTVYEVGRLPDARGERRIAVAEIGMTCPTAGTETERAISYFQPVVALFVGVAGGLKDVGLGDVVAATKVYGYEHGKAEVEFRPRPMVANSSYPLQQLARAEARNKAWLGRIAERTAGPRPRVFVGPIASGDKVIASQRSAVFGLIRDSFGDALAVEMEGYGFLQAIQANFGVQGIVIRGISDLVEGKAESDAGGYQELAACHASAFAVELLSKLGETRLPRVAPADLERFRHLKYSTAERDMEALLECYTPEAVTAAVADQYDKEKENAKDDARRRAWLCAALRHVPGAAARTFLGAVAADSSEHELVRLETRRALEAHGG